MLEIALFQLQVFGHQVVQHAKLQLRLNLSQALRTGLLSVNKRGHEIKIGVPQIPKIAHFLAQMVSQIGVLEVLRMQEMLDNLGALLL